jgi:pimeloyl-ACP methyl ester carboxylesterase
MPPHYSILTTWFRGIIHSLSIRWSSPVNISNGDIYPASDELLPDSSYGGAPWWVESSVVLIHAVGHDLTYWDRQIEALRAEYNVVAFDLPGHGRSSGAPEDWSFDHAAAIVAKLIEEVSLKPVHLVGISFALSAGTRVGNLKVTRFLQSASLWTLLLTHSISVSGGYRHQGSRRYRQ